MSFRGRGRIKTSESTISPVHLLILALLNRGPSHGYRILRHLQKRFGDDWELKSGTIYPALRRMLEKDLITSEHVPQEDRPDTLQYHLTPMGKRVLDEAFQSLKTDFRTQDRMWRFLGSSINGKPRAALMRWATREKSPIGFVALRRHCETERCGQVHLDFLVQYRQYLRGELEWVTQRLQELKSSDES